MSSSQTTERVVVGVSGSVANLAALHAGAEAARRLAAPLVAVLAWVPVGGELAYRRAPCPLLLRVWHNAARDRLGRAFDDAFGGLPDDLAIEGLAIRGAAGPVLTTFADHPSDLLIAGAGRRAPWLHGVRRYCLRHARCPVQIVEPPAMIHELRNRRWLEGELRQTISHPAR
jgi:nucleotide-binding universal stress UspA family protein